MAADGMHSRRPGTGEQMMLIYELSWLWKLLGIAISAAAAGAVCMWLICRAMKKKAGKAVLIFGGVLGLMIALAGVFIAAGTPMPV